MRGGEREREREINVAERCGGRERERERDKGGEALRGERDERQTWRSAAGRER